MTYDPLDTNESDGDADGGVTVSSLSDESGNTMLSEVVATGQVSLSSGSADVPLGISTTDATFMVAIGVDDPGADAEVAASLFFDDSANEYEIRIRESSTSSNPTVNYDVIRVR